MNEYFYIFTKYIETIFTYGFPVYVIWDWFHTRNIQRNNETEGVVFGFKHATLAWALKMFVFYWLISISMMYVQSIFYIVSDGVTMVNQGTVEHKLYASFQSKEVLTDIQSINPASDDSPIEITVTQGVIPCGDLKAFWVNGVFTLLLGVFGIAILFMLLLIICPISQKKPFSIKNVNRLRWLAFLVLAMKGSEWLYKFANNWIVTQNFLFPSHSGMEMHEVEYPIVVILCLGLIVIAEIINSASELKEDADLTV